MKTCTYCGEDKPASEYYKDSRRPGGLRTWCKPCTKYRDELYRDSTPELQKARTAKWRAANPEHNKQWREANREYVKKYDAWRGHR